MSTTSAAEPAAGPSFQQALARIRDVEGWLSEDQARRLWDAARTVRAGGRIVEIGSFRGRSTIVLAIAAQPGVELVAIDPHGGGDRGPQEIAPEAERGDADHRVFNANLEAAGVSGAVRHLRRRSDEALAELAGPVTVLYVDGAHRYGPARADIESWGDRVSPGGTMLIHDAFNAVGVMLAQLRLLVGSRRWRYVGRSGSLAEYRRQNLSALQAAGSMIAQLAALPYFARNALIKVLLLLRLRALTRPLGLGDEPWPY